MRTFSSQLKKCSFYPNDFVIQEIIHKAIDKVPEAGFLDLNNYYCINYTSVNAEDYFKAKCYTVIGNILAFRDQWHIGAVFGASLASSMETKSRKLLE